MADVRLLLFDLDGTLITSYMDREDKDYRAWWVYPGTREALDFYRRDGRKVGVITNQAGVGFGYNSIEDWEAKRDEAAELLGLRPEDFFVCFGHPKADPPYNDPTECRRRKPAAGMIFEAMEHFGARPEETIFVGDMDSDAEAARHARITFIGAGEFFDFKPGAMERQ